MNITNSNKNIRYNAESTSFTCYNTEGSDVQIYRKSSNIDGIQTTMAETTATKNKGAYTITGQKEDRNRLGKGIHIIDGKKMIVK